MKLINTFTFFIFLTNLAFAQGALVNAPSMSPDGQKIAFNYQGDIWTANVDGSDIKRITIHEAYDTKPLWGADGKQIAFQSNRFGGYDIFTVPAEGGIPKRITYHSTSDYLTDYTASGDIIFSTRRNFVQVENEMETHIVSAHGGTPKRYLDALGFDARLSPNGKFVVFTKGYCRIQREAYQGSANRDIWLYDIKNDKYTQLTVFEGNDFYPQWADNNTIYFQSSRSGRYNVYKLEIDNQGEKNSDISQITNFKDMGIFSFNLSRNGKDIVLVKGDELYHVNVVTQDKKAINLDIASDYKFYPVSHKTFTSRIEDVAISPNGEKSAFVIRGELFVKTTNKDDKKTVNLSKSAYRDRMPAWLNDSTLVFVSDREGQNDFYLVKSGDEKESDLVKTLKYEVVRLTKTSEDEKDPVISPDGKSIAFSRGTDKLIVAEINSKGNITNENVLLNGWASPSGVSWSPDSKWLAYSLSDLEFNNEIYIHKADNSESPVNISMHPKQDMNPIWSPDGSKLMFSSNRNNGDYDIWFTWLKKADWEKTPEDWKDEEAKSKSKSSAKKGGKSKDSITPIAIDFEDIHERQVQVTASVGGEFGEFFCKDGKTIYYTTGSRSRGNAKVDSDLFKISWDKKGEKSLTSNNSKPAHFSVDSKSSKVLFTRGSGTLSVMSLSSNKPESLSVSAKMDVDYFKESDQIFEEAWRAINDGFYDPNFHGRDWEALKKVYKPLAMKASTRSDFQNIFNWMLGQVNASHMGFRNGENLENVQRESTGLLGVELKPLSNGHVEVTSLVSGMPASKSTSRLYKGDVITAVNGVDLDKKTNFYSLFQGVANQIIYLNVNRANEKREVLIRPEYSNQRENYLAWVKERKRLTDKYSNGKLGYVHIEGMNWQSFEEFERELTAAGYGKEGIVIDVRYNGGGWTTDYLMAVLNVKQHAYTVPRGAAENLEKEHTKFKNHYPYSERLPFAAWTKPSIALCNSNSYSNAEIFSHAYKSLEIGTLVGEPTFGAVISTGSASLMDGSMVRMPFRGWYNKETGKNMDFVPAMPDILVKQHPGDKAKGVDLQLKAAVDALLKQI
ncbi:S41 family peptidase [Gaetbulibacter saemankumensis]|uniref:S41 family peptidase n=1 Tax=Gaetbulibacter saemankumensis TaxID=311208 RepID=UPI000426ECE0|nr:S41 family peptidase [Gaetbulibacter saemankumensis]